MNILKSRYPELQPLVRACPHLTADEKSLFRTVYLTHKMTVIQVRQWKELSGRQRTAPMMDTPTFLFHLLIQCQTKNRQHLLLNNVNVKSIKSALEPFQYEAFLEKNPLISHLCRSPIWMQRRQVLADDVLIYLLSELSVLECLSRKRQLFVQLSGSNETFYGLPYYQTRNEDERKRVEARRANLHRRKRTIQFHLHATRQGQQAHLTDLHQSLIARHLMYYHVSRHERFDAHHPIETCSNGETLVDAMIKSKFSQTFFDHRPKQEVVSLLTDSYGWLLKTCVEEIDLFPLGRNTSASSTDLRSVSSQSSPILSKTAVTLAPILRPTSRSRIDCHLGSTDSSDYIGFECTTAPSCLVESCLAGAIIRFQIEPTAIHS